jgi:excinuclease UvrABC nuclease subunit
MPTKTLNLDWKEYCEYTADNVQKYAPTKGGVYKIAIKQKDGTLKVRYVGQTDDLDRRLKEHLDLHNEPNECLKQRLQKYSAHFSFAEVSLQSDRDGCELALYNHYKPVCNDPDGIPNGPALQINVK